MKIKDLINKIKNIHFVQIHYSYDNGYHGGYKTYTLHEIINITKETEFDWFQVTTFKNKPCLEIHLYVNTKI